MTVPAIPLACTPSKQPVSELMGDKGSGEPSYLGCHAQSIGGCLVDMQCIWHRRKLWCAAPRHCNALGARHGSLNLQFLADAAVPDMHQRDHPIRTSK